MKPLIVTLLAGGAVLAVQLLGVFSAADESKPLKHSTVEKSNLGSTKPIHKVGNVYLAGQPSQEDFKLAKENGIKTVINLRPKQEQDWDEAVLVKSLKMEYVHLPFRAPATLTDDIFSKSREILKNAGEKPVLLHCASANRVGAVWLAHRVLDHGIKYDDAVKEAQRVGLKLPAYEERAKEYIDRVK